MSERVPITVFGGFLGAGKTTIILNLIKELPKNYRVVWLKNEYGDTAIDSVLAHEKNIAVKEIVNGCLCCVLIGRLGEALKEIVATYKPERIIIETSGSAYPGPIALEIRKLGEPFYLDGLINVIDALNFPGYIDKSYTAKLSTQFTDLILINKHEGLSERQLDDILDDVYELNLDTPKIKTNRGKVDPSLVFGLDSNLPLKFIDSPKIHNEVEMLEITSRKIFQVKEISRLLHGLPKDNFYRIKGMINTDDGVKMLNYVFGRFDFTSLKEFQGPTQLLFLGQALSPYKGKIQNFFSEVK